jgi:hypothetical protein
MKKSRWLIALEDENVTIFETSGTTDAAAHCHIPEELNTQPHQSCSVTTGDKTTILPNSITNQRVDLISYSVHKHG